MKLKRSRAKQLNLKPRTQLSPVMEKSCLVASAKSSYQEAERDIELMMGMRVGHSNLHRLVQRSEIPEGQSQKNIESLSVDGGKVRLRTKEQGPCEWRDYKAVSLHNSVCGAYFQDNEALVAWVQRQPLSSMITCVGDGHDGVWNIIKPLAPDSKRREVLDWFHLLENLYKMRNSRPYLERLKALLWSGFVEDVWEELRPLDNDTIKKFRAYLTKHRHRIIPYDLYQALGLPIGSGSVESTVKRLGARLKISGAQWLPHSVPQILRLRCAYLNGDISLSISS